MNHLLRELAPVSGEAWAAIDEEASRTLRHFLAARKVVDFSGPHGWAHSAETLGRVDALGASPAAGVDAAIRRMQPLAELRTPFERRAPQRGRLNVQQSQHGRPGRDIQAHPIRGRAVEREPAVHFEEMTVRSDLHRPIAAVADFDPPRFAPGVQLDRLRR